MQKRIYGQICIWVASLMLYSCSEHEVLTTFEEVKMEEPIPIVFGTYTNESADTRANYNYLVGLEGLGNHARILSGNVVDGVQLYSNKVIPWLDITGSDYSSMTTNAQKQWNLGQNRGKKGTNNYIIGVYGFQHVDVADWATATDATNLSSLTANFMTNQPVVHSQKIEWIYSPMRYWPNKKANEKVSFFAYYPFQDFASVGGAYCMDGSSHDYGDGTITKADLTNIVPPAAGATGEAAYSIEFTQKEDVAEHVDLMISTITTLGRTDNSEVQFDMRHALSLMQVDLAFTQFWNANNANTNDKSVINNEYGKAKEIKMTVKTIKFTNFINKGSVTPPVSGNPTWTRDDTEKADYIINANKILDFQYTGGSYNVVDGYRVFTGGAYKYNGSGSGPKGYEAYVYGYDQLMLVIPQPVASEPEADRKTVEVTYDLELTYVKSDGTEEKIKYEDCVDSRGLYNDGNDNYLTFDELQSNARYIFKIVMGMRRIDFEVTQVDWDYEVEREVVVDENSQGS